MSPRWTLPGMLWIMLPVSAAGQEAPGTLAGEWVGAWGRDADTLAVVMRFQERDGSWSGSFDSDRLRLEGIPFTSVEMEGERVTIRMVGDATTIVFVGGVEGDTLRGLLQEEEAFGWFAATRRRAVATVGPTEEDVRFSNGDVELAGSLLLPAGPGPHPAVVFLHGSGDEGRWPSRHIAGRLTRAGFAALIWDKRGVGASTGSWREVGFDELAADAAAAVAFARSRPEIDPARVGIHGHSQGGTYAPQVAVLSGADFVIASAAAGLPMDEVEIYSIGSWLGIPSMPADEAALARAYVEGIVDVAYRGAPRDSLVAVEARAREREWYFEPPASDDSYWAFSRRIAGYDALAWWRQVRAPVLLVYGSVDGRVPVEPSRAAIVGAIEASRQATVEVRVFDGADHTFRIRREGDIWPRTVEGYPDALLEWLHRLPVDASRGSGL